MVFFPVAVPGGRCFGVLLCLGWFDRAVAVSVELVETLAKLLDELLPADFAVLVRVKAGDALGRFLR